MQAGLNWKPGMEFKKSQILIYWSIMYKFFSSILDLLTKNRGIDWLRDFRYCREVGLAWQGGLLPSRGCWSTCHTNQDIGPRSSHLYIWRMCKMITRTLQWPLAFLREFKIRAAWFCALCDKLRNVKTLR